jgi:hypothetical protein
MIFNCAYTSGNQIGYYSSNKNEKWVKNFGEEIFRDIALVKGQILAVSRHNLYLIASASGETIWNQKTENPTSFTACDLAFRNGRLCLAWGTEIDRGREVSADTRHIEGGYTLAIEGQGGGFHQQNGKLNYLRWNIFTPEVKFVPQGLLIQTMDEVKLQQIPEGK